MTHNARALDIEGDSSFRIDAASLVSSLRRVGPAASRDGDSPLSGVLLFARSTGTALILATDGHVAVQVDEVSLTTRSAEDVVAVLPRSLVRRLTRQTDVDGSYLLEAIVADDPALLVTDPAGHTIRQPLWRPDAHIAIVNAWYAMRAECSTTVLAPDFDGLLAAARGARSATVVFAPERLILRTESGPAGAPITASEGGDPVRVDFDAARLFTAWDALIAQGGLREFVWIERFVGSTRLSLSQGMYRGEDLVTDAPAAWLIGGDEPLIDLSPWEDGAVPRPGELEEVPTARDDLSSAGASVEQILAELDAIVGQAPLKREVEALVSQVRLNRKRVEHGLAVANVAVHMAFTGPPGTGKTTVARLIARLLHALGAIESDVVKEVDASGLVAAHIGGTEEKTAAVIDEAMGGVLFVDEAPGLVSGDATFGRKAVEVLLKALDDRRGDFVCIVAGYSAQMTEFLASDPGLVSRFARTIPFEPYRPAELVQIATGMAGAGDNTISSAAEERLRARLDEEHARGGFDRPAWGNARTIRNVVDSAAHHRDLRISEAGLDDVAALTTIEVSDMVAALDGFRIGRTVGADESVDDVLAALAEQVGQAAVKQQVAAMVAGARAAQRRAEQGLGPAVPDLPHVLFTGPPGTGKTTIARLLARLYRALGMLPTGHVVEVDRSRLVAAHIGGTAQLTAEAIDEAMGGVLFIDEAYTLAQGGSQDFGGEAVATLLKRMSDEQGKFLVIAAGYGPAMADFLAMNDGLPRRFPTRIEFAAYSASELAQIATLSARRRGDTLTAEADQLLAARLRAAEADGAFAKTDWGNAGSINNLVEHAARHRNTRLFVDPTASPSAEELTLLTAEDVTVAADALWGATDSREDLASVLAELDAQIGQDELKDQVQALMATIREHTARHRAGLATEGPMLQHLVFSGPPGTGKTTIARLVARLYRALGVLSSGHVVEVDRSALVAGYVGQTAIKTDERITEAMGGVLFVDEAYTLVGDQFGTEAINTLLVRMENDRGRFVVIAAGYPEQMSDFLRSNPGLPSRFAPPIRFGVYSAEDLRRIAVAMLAARGERLTPDAAVALRTMLEAAESAGAFLDREWGNARTVRNLVDEAGRRRARRLYRDAAAEPMADELVTIEKVDLLAAAASSPGLAQWGQLA